MDTPDFPGKREYDELMAQRRRMLGDLGGETDLERLAKSGALGSLQEQARAMEALEGASIEKSHMDALKPMFEFDRSVREATAQQAPEIFSIPAHVMHDMEAIRETRAREAEKLELQRRSTAASEDALRELRGERDEALRREAAALQREEAAERREKDAAKAGARRERIAIWFGAGGFLGGALAILIAWLIAN